MYQNKKIEIITDFKNSYIKLKLHDDEGNMVIRSRKK